MQVIANGLREGQGVVVVSSGVHEDGILVFPSDLYEKWFI